MSVNMPSSYNSSYFNYNNQYTNPYNGQDDAQQRIPGMPKSQDGNVDNDPDNKKKQGYKSSPEECQTCKNRTYQDGSDEMVSFKSAAHIDPANSSAIVSSHEHEHVSNAYAKASQHNGKVTYCSVTLHTSICPECGRAYVSGGQTNTQIKYYNPTNPYQKSLKASDAINKYRGALLNALA